MLHCYCDTSHTLSQLLLSAFDTKTLSMLEEIELTAVYSIQPTDHGKLLLMKFNTSVKQFW